MRNQQLQQQQYYIKNRTDDELQVEIATAYQDHQGESGNQARRESVDPLNQAKQGE